MKKIFLALTLLAAGIGAQAVNNPVSYVNTLVGSHSSPALSTGNTYPAIALPWGMNFWTPQTGKMGDGWAYTYDADKIRGFKQTHQPSPWMNDYGMFNIMPTIGEPVFDQDKRASWFNHKSETATPYYYKVYLADYDIVTEIAPTNRAAIFRFTWAFRGFLLLVIVLLNVAIAYAWRKGGTAEQGRNAGIQKMPMGNSDETDTQKEA